MNRTNNEMDMLHGPLAGKMVLFALPLAASSVLQQLFNAADLAVVGRFASAEAMAAVGSNSSVISLMVSLFVGMSVGANVVIANLLGSGRRDEVSDAVHTVIAVALIAGAGLLCLGVGLASPILTLMGAPENVMNLAKLYLRIYFLGMPAIMIYNYGSAILRSRGDSRRPFLALTLAGLLNVALNLLFVVVFHWHVVGVALATVLSNCLSAGLTLRFLVKSEGEFRLDLGRLRLRKKYLAGLLHIGLPAGLQGMVFSLSNVVIQTAVNSFGADCIAGMTAAQNFEFMSYCVVNAFSQTAVTFISQNYGAHDKARCRRVFSLAMLLGLGSDAVVLVLIYLTRGTLIRIFTTDPAVIAYSMIRFSIVVAPHILIGSYEIPGGALRGLNRSMVPALISVLGTCAFRLLYVFTFFPAHRSIETLLAVYPASWVLTGIAMNVAFRTVWKRSFPQ
ncbi:MAG: MATE family efflux transporter [Oscillospiraceae bacterium]|nr:MATE family efflux transporter [Oscillospiraceae bacterium]